MYLGYSATNNWGIHVLRIVLIPFLELLLRDLVMT